MVPIQYQESVHCLAFVLHLLSAVRGGVAAALADGVRLEARSDPYEPPNPEAYPYVVNGRCRFRATFGDLRVEGLTDFKRGAEWAKRRVIRGIGDGRPFEIEVSYLEGRKSLRIDGDDQPCDPSASSYEHVLATATRWARQVGRDGLMTGLYPNPRFTHVTYQLSAALCAQRATVRSSGSTRPRTSSPGTRALRGRGRRRGVRAAPEVAGNWHAADCVGYHGGSKRRPAREEIREKVNDG